MGQRAVTGQRRLAVFLTGTWLAGWAFMYAIDPHSEWEGFVVLAGSPAALAWGAWWVWKGFDTSQGG